MGGLPPIHELFEPRRSAGRIPRGLSRREDIPAESLKLLTDSAIETESCKRGRPLFGVKTFVDFDAKTSF